MKLLRDTRIPGMKVEPRPGERVSDYLERYAHELLMRAGARETEAPDFADVLVCQSGRDILRMTFADARERLEGWRAEKRETAEQFREDRWRRRAAGYLGLEPDEPVYLNGVTAW